MIRQHTDPKRKRVHDTTRASPSVWCAKRCKPARSQVVREHQEIARSMKKDHVAVVFFLDAQAQESKKGLRRGRSRGPRGGVVTLRSQLVQAVARQHLVAGAPCKGGRRDALRKMPGVHRREDVRPPNSHARCVPLLGRSSVLSAKPLPCGRDSRPARPGSRGNTNIIGPRSFSA